MLLVLLFLAASASAQMLVFEDNFDTLDTEKWEHELTMGGGGVTH